jgi:hypothetical protein
MGGGMEHRTVDRTGDNDPFASEFYFSITPLFFPHFNLFAKEIEVQRTGRLIKVDILALTLIALHKQVAF